MRTSRPDNTERAHRRDAEDAEKRRETPSLFVVVVVVAVVVCFFSFGAVPGLLCASLRPSASLCVSAEKLFLFFPPDDDDSMKPLSSPKSYG
jgi:hypothetical protein